MQLTVRWLLSKARPYVAANAPYAYGDVEKLIPHPVPGLLREAGGVLATTDRMVLMYDPDELPKDEYLSKPECLAAGLMHEYLHHVQDKKQYALQAHISRKAANLAADIVVNQWLEKDEGAKWKLPAYAVLPGMFGFPYGKTQEWYFRELLKKQQAGAPTPSPKYMAGMNGSLGGVTDDKLREIEEKANEEAQGRDIPEVRELAAKAAGALRKYAQSTRGPHSDQWVSEDVATVQAVKTIPWRMVIKSTLTRAVQRVAAQGSSVYTYGKPSTTMLALGQYMPGLVTMGCDVAFVRDTSCSMHGELLATANAYIVQCLLALNQRNALVCDVDSAVRREFTRVSVNKLAKLPAAGRGGTDFRPLFQMIDTMPRKNRPRIVAYLTDGEGYYPSAAPSGYATLWCIVGSTATPPWGTVVHID